MKILAIETSCDETSASILEIKNGRFNLLSNIVSSQVKIHARYGGIVPEVAARKQIEDVVPVINESIKKAKIKLSDIDYFAVTQGPGLVTSLTVGVEATKTLSVLLKKPLISVNHVTAHLLANHLSNHKIKYPALGLIVSGGHTLLVLIKNESTFKIIGTTQDDAVGEAFDKVAKILNLGYPGGPIISHLAEKGDPNKYKFARPMISQKNLDFSFSGLKTAVLYLVQDLKKKKINIKKEIPHISASFQAAAVDVLVSKTLRALRQHKVKSFLLGGGVSANQALRDKLKQKINSEFTDLDIFIPELKFTGDNAAMIAVASYFKIKDKKFADAKSLRSDPHLKI